MTTPMLLHRAKPARPAIRSVLALLAPLFGGCVGTVGGEPEETVDPGSPPVTPGGAPSAGPPAAPGAPAEGVTTGSAPVPAPGAAPGAPGAAPCGLPPRRIWKLTPDQYTNTVNALLPNAGDPGEALYGSLSLQGRLFTNESDHLEMAPPHVERLLGSARSIAAAVVERHPQLALCRASSAPAVACGEAFVADFGAKAFRRPLSAEERSRALAFYRTEAGKHGVAAALRQTVQATLMSPHFLYRTELGEPGAAAGKAVALSAYERASALSYFLLDGPPDADLLRAAAGDALRTAAQVEVQARRLLERPETARGLMQFFGELLHTEAVRSAEKFDKAFTPVIAEEMARETALFIENVLWQGDGRWPTLLAARHSILNQRLATFYGLPSGTARSTFGPVPWPPGQRAGLLSQGSFLAVHAGNEESDPILRGAAIRERLLCQQLPPPPADLAVVPPPPDGMRTQRERLAQHASDPRCATCHALMDPIGFALEPFDAVGRHRTTEAGKPIDARGKLVGAGPEQAFTGAVELADVLARSPAAAACAVEQLYRYGLGRAPERAGIDRCALDGLGERFARSGGDVRDLAVAIATADSFLMRSN